MPIVNNTLLKTGRGNPSPIYDPDLSRFNGWARQAPTLVRLPVRGKPLGHPAHTPAVPLIGRTTPNMPQYQIPAAPHTVCFHISIAGVATEFHTSPIIATPAVITQLYLDCWLQSNVYQIQAALTSTPITTDAQLAACPKFFTVAPENFTWDQPFFLNAGTLVPHSRTIPLNIPIPAGPRNRIVVRIFNNTEVEGTIFLAFHIQPYQEGKYEAP